MALDTLAQGRLIKPATSRTSAAGKPYCTAQMSVNCGGDDSALLSLIAFNPEVVGALLTLDAGDGLAVIGRAKPSAWSDKTSGEPRAGLYGPVLGDMLVSLPHRCAGFEALP